MGSGLSLPPPGFTRDLDGPGPESVRQVVVSRTPETENQKTLYLSQHGKLWVKILPVTGLGRTIPETVVGDEEPGEVRYGIREGETEWGGVEAP